jgi:hypothetical protein
MTRKMGSLGPIIVHSRGVRDTPVPPPPPGAGKRVGIDSEGEPIRKSRWRSAPRSLDKGGSPSLRTSSPAVLSGIIPGVCMACSRGQRALGSACECRLRLRSGPTVTRGKSHWRGTMMVMCGLPGFRCWEGGHGTGLPCLFGAVIAAVTPEMGWFSMV